MAIGWDEARVSDYISDTDQSSLVTYQSAWTRWANFCKEKADTDQLIFPSPNFALSFVRVRATESPSQRPSAIIKAWTSCFGWLHTALKSKNPLKEIATEIKGIRKANTFKPVRRDPSVDMNKVARTAKEHFDDLDEDTAPEAVRRLAVVSIAWPLPSRPSEIVALKLSDIEIVRTSHVLGLAGRPLKQKLHFWVRSPDEGLLYDELTASETGFRLTLSWLETKVDKEKEGMDKPLVHTPGQEFSPASILLKCATMLHKDFQRSPPDDKAYLVFKGANPNTPLSPDWCSNNLCTFAFLAGGEKSKATAWRSSAACFLLAAGIPFGIVAKLGGWRNEETLRNFYTRHQMIDGALARLITAAVCAAFSTDLADRSALSSSSPSSSTLPKPTAPSSSASSEPAVGASPLASQPLSPKAVGKPKAKRVAKPTAKAVPLPSSSLAPRPSRLNAGTTTRYSEFVK